MKVKWETGLRQVLTSFKRLKGLNTFLLAITQEETKIPALSKKIPENLMQGAQEEMEICEEH